MRHIIHDVNYDVAILVKDSALSQSEIEQYYVRPGGFKAISFTLDYAGKKKPTALVRKDYLEELLPALDSIGIKDIICADGEYFKALAKVQKTDPYYGAILPCKIKGYEHMNICLGANYQAAIFNPAIGDKIRLCIQTMQKHKAGIYEDLGTGIIHSEAYPSDYLSIQHMLGSLHQYDAITSDIEAFSLKHYSAGIGSIGFAWDCHNGFSFAVDYKECDPYEIQVWDKKDKKFKTKTALAYAEYNKPIRDLLRTFFETYKGKIIWHNASFDCYILVYQLWMNDLLDQEGLLKGLDIMHKSMECTKLITYLATNSTAGNKLSLKEQAHEFAGNYAESDINNILLIPYEKLLRYNLIDCLATWYVMDRHYDSMVIDNQLSVYEDLFKPAVADIIQMQLTGMCLDMDKVLEAETYMQGIYDTHLDNLRNSPLIQSFVEEMRLNLIDLDNATLVNKKRLYTDPQIQRIVFNPNSGPQLQKLLYDVMELPVLDKTISKQPATGRKTLKKLKHHVNQEFLLLNDSEVIERENIIEDLIGFNTVNKVLTSFIPAFKEAPMASDGMYYLFGNFNLGGTVSGRLSANNPNLQQIPSGSTYAKAIKACFIAPKGWLFGGADSASLEDRIDALQTKDPNKLKVYTDGYDGHCLRAFYYFGDQMPEINESVSSINSIAKLFKELRQDSKAPTFALTYEGNWVTLKRNNGFSEEKAKSIENSYLEAYAHSVKWKAERIKECCKVGYATVAFGLRVRTPLLHKSILGNSVTPYQSAAEGRTVGNAMGQSFGLLNTRAGMEVMRKVRASKYKYLIKPCAQIHDALYFRWYDDIHVTKFLNDIVGQAMAWQNLPEIEHDLVKLSGELDIFYPSWKDAITLKNNISEEDILKTLTDEAIARQSQ